MAGGQSRNLTARDREFLGRLLDRYVRGDLPDRDVMIGLIQKALESERIADCLSQRDGWHHHDGENTTSMI